MTPNAPWLSLSIWIPVIAGLVVLAAGSDRNAREARVIALIGSLAGFLATIPLYVEFNTATSAMQFVELTPWIERFHINCGRDAGKGPSVLGGEIGLMGGPGLAAPGIGGGAPAFMAGLAAGGTGGAAPIQVSLPAGTSWPAVSIPCALGGAELAGGFVTGSDPSLRAKISSRLNEPAVLIGSDVERQSGFAASKGGSVCAAICRRAAAIGPSSPASSPQSRAAVKSASTTPVTAVRKS